MLSSQKVFYLVLFSIMLLCSIFGISVQGTNVYFPVDVIVTEQTPESSGIVAELSDMSSDSGFDSTSVGVDISVGEQQTTTEDEYVHDDNVSIIETTTTSMPTTASSEASESAGREPSSVSTSGRTSASQSANSTTSSSAATTTRSTTTARTTTTTRSTTTRATTTQPTTAYTTTTVRTTTTTRPVTVATKSHNNTGSISFALSSGGTTVTEYRMYAGTSVRIYLKSGFGDTPIAAYESEHPYIADKTSSDVGSVVVTAYTVGTTWIRASNANGTCYIKIIVDDYESRVVYLCNQQRAAYGIAPLEVGGSDLKRVANLRLSEIYAKFDHYRPNGSRYITAYDNYGLSYMYAGENLARGQTTPEQVVSDWMNSPRHRENIMNPNFKYCSVSIGNSQYDGHMYTYWSQQFYTPLY